MNYVYTLYTTQTTYVPIFCTITTSAPIVITLPVSDAVRKSPDGVVIDIEVTPGTKTAKVPSGYNTWRKRIEVRLSEPAQKGKANQQLLELMAVVLGIKISEVTLISGLTSHRKTIHVSGMDVEQVIELLSPPGDKD
ncbi:MAG: DUF167 domain-containing protein [Methanosarcinales archaeon]|nr:DUF167 domain-containing protein [ANME-2 cluster archaeon]MDF1532405.1 DUF167 domain-containing protein [ANME-2 cluster archaeon]MDW7776010.1 DUF167 domain-containing protein [Methanosarcinales archaeon]